MKIGILTYHCACNYGAVLQCYALQEYLREVGHEVNVIDYRPNYLKHGLFVWYNWISWKPQKFLRKILFQMKTFSKQWDRYVGFKRFLNKRLNVRKLDMKNKNNDYNCFIFGSDQIWRKNNGCFDKIYWGDFNAAKGHRLISYAVSMGGDTPSNEEKEKIKKWLRDFSAINVRESSLITLIKPLTVKNVELTIDPTFLLTKKQWEKIESRPRYEKKYVLIYQVISNPSSYLLAQQVAKLLDLDIIEISSKIIEKARKNVFETATPEEFIGWIHNARFVITTSFHGTAFSLIFRKPFICIKQNNSSDLRIESILSQFGLLNHFVDCKNPELDENLLKKPSIKDGRIIEYSKNILKKSLS